MLTDAAIIAAKPTAKPFKLFDTHGLFLIITPSGGRWWRFKYRLKGKHKSLSLGLYPGVSINAARAQRDEIKRQLEQGIDPSVARKNAKAAELKAKEQALEQGSGTQRGIAAFAGKRTNELTAHESVVLSNACGSAFGSAFGDAFADRVIARLEKYVVRVPSGEETE
jgi:Arm DNA-binding domain